MLLQNYILLRLVNLYHRKLQFLQRRLFLIERDELHHVLAHLLGVVYAHHQHLVFDLQHHLPSILKRQRSRCGLLDCLSFGISEEEFPCEKSQACKPSDS